MQSFVIPHVNDYVLPSLYDDGYAILHFLREHGYAYDSGYAHEYAPNPHACVHECGYVHAHGYAAG